MNKLFLKILKYALVTIAWFMGVQLSFKALNTASTIGNIGGLLLLMYLITFALYHIYKLLKQYINSQN